VTNSGPTPTTSWARSRPHTPGGEPKRLEILRFEATGAHTEPGLGQAMRSATAWLD